MVSEGVFAQCGHSAGTAPIVTVFIPGTPLQTTPLQKRVRSIQNSVEGVDFKALGPVASGGGEQPTLGTGPGAPPLGPSTAPDPTTPTPAALCA